MCNLRPQVGFLNLVFTWLFLASLGFCQPNPQPAETTDNTLKTSEYRIWTKADGKKLEMKITGKGGGWVYFVMKNGRRHSCSARQFCAEDQQLVREWRPSPPNSGNIAKQSAPETDESRQGSDVREEDSEGPPEDHSEHTGGGESEESAEGDAERTEEIDSARARDDSEGSPEDHSERPGGIDGEESAEGDAERTGEVDSARSRDDVTTDGEADTATEAERSPLLEDLEGYLAREDWTESTEVEAIRRINASVLANEYPSEQEARAALLKQLPGGFDRLGERLKDPVNRGRMQTLKAIVELTALADQREFNEEDAKDAVELAYLLAEKTARRDDARILTPLFDKVADQMSGGVYAQEARGLKTYALIFQSDENRDARQKEIAKRRSNELTVSLSNPATNSGTVRYVNTYDLPKPGGTPDGQQELRPGQKIVSKGQAAIAYWDGFKWVMVYFVEAGTLEFEFKTTGDEGYWSTNFVPSPDENAAGMNLPSDSLSPPEVKPSSAQLVSHLMPLRATPTYTQTSFTSGLPTVAFLALGDAGENPDTEMPPLRNARDRTAWNTAAEVCRELPAGNASLARLSNYIMHATELATLANTSAGEVDAQLSEKADRDPKILQAEVTALKGKGVKADEVWERLNPGILRSRAWAKRAEEQTALLEEKLAQVRAKLNEVKDEINNGGLSDEKQMELVRDLTALGAPVDPGKGFGVSELQNLDHRLQGLERDVVRAFGSDKKLDPEAPAEARRGTLDLNQTIELRLEKQIAALVRDIETWEPPPPPEDLDELKKEVTDLAGRVDTNVETIKKSEDDIDDLDNEISGPGGLDSRLVDASAKIKVLEEKVTEPGGLVDVARDSSAKILELDDKINRVPGGLEDRLTTTSEKAEILENEINSPGGIKEAVTKNSGRIDDLEGETADLSVLQDRVVSLEKSFQLSVFYRGRTEFSRGVHHFWAGQWDLAIERLRAATRLSPEWPDPHYFLAFAHGCKGNASLATKVLKVALALDQHRPIKYWDRLMTRLQGPLRHQIELLRTKALAGLAIDVPDGMWEVWKDGTALGIRPLLSVPPGPSAVYYHIRSPGSVVCCSPTY